MSSSFVRPRALTLALALSTAPALLMAQATGTVRGRVTDASAARGIPDVQVMVTGTRIGSVTGADGAYTLTAVPSGTRSITARRLGYQPATQSGDRRPRWHRHRGFCDER